MSLDQILLQRGAPVLAKVIGQRFGKDAEEIARVGLEALADAFGLPPTAAREDIEAAVRPENQTVARRIAEAEANMPDLLLAQTELQRARNAQQEKSNELLMAAMAKGPLWTWAWLYLWQYFLMAVWGWTLVVVHLANAGLRLAGQLEPLPAPGIADLLTLTGLYLSLHMGGHTVLELMRNKWGREGAPGDTK
jgi:hypothetical protein